jgi:hypothetical protein
VDHPAYPVQEIEALQHLPCDFLAEVERQALVIIPLYHI